MKTALTPTTPLRLEKAAQLAFPDGSISASTLRRMIVAGKLDAELIAGKYFVTLAAIGEMRNRCRVQAKVPASGYSPHAGTKPVGPSNRACGASETGDSSEALASARAILRTLKAPSETTSPASTERLESASVIPLPSRSPT